jgi:protoporphyrinogen oxidase
MIIKVDNLIIGAGPSGLTAGYSILKNKDLGNVEIIESSEKYLGGISRTESKGDYRFDIGGHRFFSKSKTINKLWDEILDDGFIETNRKSRILFKKKFFNYPLSATEALFKLGIFESFLCGISFFKAKIFPKKNPISFHDWVANSFGERLYRNFFKTYTEKVWGMSCDEISADWAAQRIKGLNFVNLILNSIKFLNFKNNKKVIKTLIKKFKYPKYGPGMMWEVAGNKIKKMNGKITMGTKANEFIYNKADKNWKIKCFNKINNENIIYECKKVICSAPLRDVVKNINPPLISKDLASKLKYRDFITVAVMIDKRPKFDDNWIYIHDQDIYAGRIQNYTSWSTYMAPSDKGCLGLEYFCNESDEFWNKTDEELKNVAIEDLNKLEILTNEKITDAYVVRQKKAYPVYDQHYKEIVKKISNEIENDYNNLYLVGRNGMHKYNNQDHAMMSSLLTVENIKHNQKLNDIWDINVDAEYHEEAKDKNLAMQNIQKVPKSINN